MNRLSQQSETFTNIILFEQNTSHRCEKYVLNSKQATGTSNYFLLWAEHVFRSYALVKFVFGHKAESESRLTQGEVFAVGVVGDPFGSVVAKHGVQSCHQHQGLGHVASYVLPIGHYACNVHIK